MGARGEIIALDVAKVDNMIATGGCERFKKDEYMLKVKVKKEQQANATQNQMEHRKQEEAVNSMM